MEIMLIIPTFINGTLKLNPIYITAHPDTSVIIIVVFLVTVIVSIYYNWRKNSEKLQRLSDLDSILSEYQANPLGFESFAAKIFSLNGYKRIRVTKPSNDGGKDIIMYKNGYKYIVEVKLYSRTNNVGREKIQKLHSAKIDEKADYAFFLTTSDFTKTAIEYAKKHSIDLINGNDFIQLFPVHRQNDFKHKIHNYNDLIHTPSNLESSNIPNKEIQSTEIINPNHNLLEVNMDGITKESKLRKLISKTNMEGNNMAKQISIGKYEWGKNIPIGSYNLKAIKGTGSINLYRKQDGELEFSFYYLSATGENNYASEFFNLQGINGEYFEIDGNLVLEISKCHMIEVD